MPRANLEQLKIWLVGHLGPDRVIADPAEVATYEYDASLDRGRPDLVVIPETEEQVLAAVRVAREFGVPIIPRGAGTGLSGGAIAPRGGLTIELSRLNRILEIDPVGRRARVEAGVVAQAISDAAAPYDIHFAPDPSSKKVATIGGMIAENAGGPHAFKYGVTSHHVTGVRLVSPEGELIRIGGAAEEASGYDLLGLLVGSEGTLGAVTEAMVRLTPNPSTHAVLLAVFDQLEGAVEAIAAIVAQGLEPAALELLDRPTIAAVEEYSPAGYPLDAEGVLLIEVDGWPGGVARQTEEIAHICREHGARSVQAATDPEHQERLWHSRRVGFAAIARIATGFMVCDGVVPRDQLPMVMAEVQGVARRFGLRIAQSFHAGDGNLHPKFFFDAGDAAGRRKAEEASHEVLRICVAHGGSISGEHGIGTEKIGDMPLVFGPVEMGLLSTVKQAFDPDGISNPGKVFDVRAIGNPPRRTTGRTGQGGRHSSLVIRHPLLDPGERLTRELGREMVSPPTADDRRFEGLVAPPRWVVRPEHPEHISAVLAICSDCGASFIPVGAGIFSHAGTVPAAIDVAVDMTGLGEGADHSPANLTATFPAGLTLAQAQEVLAPQGQRIPCDGPPHATLGEIIATAATGPERLALGPLRHSVLGLTVVLPSGQIARLGGRVTKNVAGYDLCKLFVGSWGTLGAMVEVTFRLRPIPEARRWLWASYGSLSDALSAVREILTQASASIAEICIPGDAEGPEAPDASFVPSTSLRTGIRHSSASRGDIGLWAAFGGFEEDVTAQMAVAIDTASKTGARNVAHGAASDPADPGAVWKEFPLSTVGAGLRARPEAAVALQAFVPPGRTEEIFAAMARLLGEAGSGFFARVGIGTGCIALRIEDGSLGEDQRHLPGECFKLIADEGTLRVLSAPIPIRQAWSAAALDPPGLPIMRRIKDAVDPLNLSAPGRLLPAL